MAVDSESESGMWGVGMEEEDIEGGMWGDARQYQQLRIEAIALQFGHLSTVFALSGLH